MPILHTCTAGVQDGVARCRKSVISEPNRTAQGSLRSPPGNWLGIGTGTNTVLVKVNVNPTWWELLHRAGVRTFVRTFARLSSWSRSTWLKRLLSDETPMHPAISGTTSKPPKARTRLPGFRKPGLTDAAMDIRGLVGTVRRRLRGFRRRTSSNGTTNRRCASSWSSSKPSQKPAMVNFPWKAFQQLVATSFGQIDVWANLKQADGNVVHTVNCGKRRIPQSAERAALRRWRLERGGNRCSPSRRARRRSRRCRLTSQQPSTKKHHPERR